jgi:phage shock protein C
MAGKKTPERGRKVHTRPRAERSSLDRQVEHFGEEVGALGEKFGRRMEHKGQEWDSWFHNTFGLVGPLISSIFGLLILALVVWAVTMVNLPIGSSFMANIGMFLVSNMGLFFLIFLFFSYTSYLSRVSPRGYLPFSPIAVAAGITMALWMVTEVLSIANLSLGISLFTEITSFTQRNLAWIFGFFLVLGYVIFSVKMAFEKPSERREYTMARTKAAGTAPEGALPRGPKRLYRSGRDRILGGVCGGIAEYLGVDPVLIRLLWVIWTLAWGSGIIAYIIAWIIIPRNPKHRWKD